MGVTRRKIANTISFLPPVTGSPGEEGGLSRLMCEFTNFPQRNALLEFRVQKEFKLGSLFDRAFEIVPEFGKPVLYL